MSYQGRIISDHRVMLGKPIIRHTRLTVELILRKLAEGATSADLLRMYPHLTEADIQAVFRYAADVLANQEVTAPLA